MSITEYAGGIRLASHIQVSGATMATVASTGRTTRALRRVPAELMIDQPSASFRSPWSNAWTPVRPAPSPAPRKVKHYLVAHGASAARRTGPRRTAPER